MILQSIDIYDNENTKGHNSSRYELLLYRINNICTFTLIKLDGLRIIIYTIERFESVKYS